MPDTEHPHIGPRTRRQASLHGPAPASGFSADDGGTRQSPRHRQGLAHTPSAFVAVAGLWLASAPFLLDYGTTEGFGGRWNDIIVGVVLMLIAMARVIAPIGTGPLSLINVGLGLWLVAAPFVLGHSRNGAPQAMWNDILVGVIVVMVAGVSFFTAESGRAPGDTVHRRSAGRSGGGALPGPR